MKTISMKQVESEIEQMVRQNTCLYYVRGETISHKKSPEMTCCVLFVFERRGK